MQIDMDAWMVKLQEKLQGEFGERLVFLGLQGSRARNEARAESDIDAVIVIDGLDTADLQAYKSIIAAMPYSEIACGFVSSSEVLANWPRYDSFNLVMDTKAYFGSLDFIDTDYSTEDAIAAAKAGASEIYHAVCHGILFDGDALTDIVKGCIKSAFFAMRALVYARTGEYPVSRARMRELATAEEKLFLDGYSNPEEFDVAHLAGKLMTWTAEIISNNQ